MESGLFQLCKIISSAWLRLGDGLESVARVLLCEILEQAGPEIEKNWDYSEEMNEEDISGPPRRLDGNQPRKGRGIQNHARDFGLHLDR